MKLSKDAVKLLEELQKISTPNVKMRLNIDHVKDLALAHTVTKMAMSTVTTMIVTMVDKDPAAFKQRADLEKVLDLVKSAGDDYSKAHDAINSLHSIMKAYD